MESQLFKRTALTIAGLVVLNGAAIAVFYALRRATGSNARDECLFMWLFFFAILWGPILDAWQSSCRNRPPEERGRCLYTVWIITTVLIALDVALALLLC